MNVLEGCLATPEGWTLPLEATDVSAEIAGALAEVTVTQRFANPLDRPIEATYLFPLPHGAAVHRMRLEIGDRVVENLIKEKGEARRDFEQARQDGQRASLLEQERADLFRLSVTHIQAGESVQVTLGYHETLDFQDDEYRFVFPLVAADRPGSGEPCADPEVLLTRRQHASQRPATVNVVVQFADRTLQPHSPTHEIRVSPGLVTLAGGDSLPNRDLVLRWKTVGPQVYLHRQSGRGGTFLVNLTAPNQPGPGQGRDLLILLDCSNSLQGQAMEQARRAVEHALSLLTPHDGIQLVAFNHLSRALVPDAGYLPASPENLSRARVFLRDMIPCGGTDLQAALRQIELHPARPARAAQVLLITDANVTLERLPNLSRPLHVLGLGNAVNRHLVERLGRQSQGSWDTLTPFEEPTEALQRLGRRLSQAGPVLDNLRLEWHGALLADVYPASLPALYAGQPLTILGRFHGSGESRLVLTGVRRDGTPWRTEQLIQLPERCPTAPGLERVWAARRIAERLERLESHPGEADGLRQEILALALRYSLASPYTAFVGVDEESLLGEPEPVILAAPEVVGSPAAGREVRYLAEPRGLVAPGRPDRAGLLSRKPSLSRDGLRSKGLMKPTLGGGKPILCPPPPPEPAPLLPLEDFYPPYELEWAENKLTGALDLVFLVDETGSMGTFIETVQRQLLRIVESVSALQLCRQLRVGLVRYRDHPPQDKSFVTRVEPLTDDIGQIRKAVLSMQASGGGDKPEAVTDGFFELLNLNWRPGSVRTVVWAGDAPPHGAGASGDGFPHGCPCGRHWLTCAEACREMGIVVHAVGCGLRLHTPTQQLFERVARLTRGLYVGLERSPLLVPLITGVAARDLDRSRIEERVAEIMGEHHATLSRLAHANDRCEFVLARLREGRVKVTNLIIPPTGNLELRLDELGMQDVQAALERREPLYSGASPSAR